VLERLLAAGDDDTRATSAAVRLVSAVKESQ
jgi:hypothetical protein